MKYQSDSEVLLYQTDNGINRVNEAAWALNNARKKLFKDISALIKKQA